MTTALLIGGGIVCGAAGAYLGMYWLAYKMWQNF